MENIPNEVLEIIFFQLSHRYLATCSKVCKKWNEIIRTPQYYHSIEIYTIKQLNKFILFAQNIKISPSYSSTSASITTSSHPSINNESITAIGEYIYHLKLHPHYLSKRVIIDLLTALPNIQSIHYFYFFNEFKDVTNLPPSKKLTHITRWFTKMNKNWMNDYLDNDHQQHIISLEFDIDDEIYPLKHTNQFIRLEPTGGLTQHRIHFDDDNNNNNNINHHEEVNDNIFNHHHHHLNNDDYIQHQGKVLILPIDTLIHLTTLKLDFTELSMEESGSYDIDERTLESIHQSCPLLESLSLDGFDMNIYAPSSSSSSSSSPLLMEYHHFQQTTNVQPANHLKNLKIYGALHDPHCFYYLSKKYPQLKTLELFLEWGQLSVEKNQPYKQAIYYFITHFPQLKKLDVTLHIYSSFGDIVLIEDGYWPNEEFMTWLHHCPNQLTYLKYPFDLPTLEDENIIHYPINSPLLSSIPLPRSPLSVINSSLSSSSIVINHYQQQQIENDFNKKTLLYNNNNEIEYVAQLYHQRRNYLNHLTSLSLTIKNNMIDETINYLLCNRTKSVASYSIKELNITYDSLVNNKEIQIYEWLNIFPNLIRLFINTIKLIKDDNDNEQLETTTTTTTTTTENTTNNTEKNQPILFYPLQEIHISNATIYFKDGFTKLCQQCPQLNTITLRYITYSVPFWHSSMDIKDITNDQHDKKEEEGFQKVIFDFSHLKLNLFYINGFCYGPWDNLQHSRKYKINTIFVEELDSQHSFIAHEKRSELEDIQYCLFSYPTTTSTSTTSLPSINNNDNINLHHSYSNISSLYLKCKYVDGLVIKRCEVF